MQQGEQRHEQQRVRGRPFPKGVNPAGKSTAVREARKTARMAELSAELGGLQALTPVEQTLLGQAVELLMTTPRTSVDRVRQANGVARILGSLRRAHGTRGRGPVEVKPAGLSYAEAMARANNLHSAPQRQPDDDGAAKNRF
jgi:hypothetical protein